jgi:hypothetical protein
MATKAKQEALIAPRLGEVWKGQGGTLGALVRGINGEPDYYLIVSPAKGYKSGLPWGGKGIAEPGAQCEYNGQANTTALVESSTDHPAAEFCTAFECEGHEDYILPSRRELRALWCTVPELFEDGWYWSSTQDSADSAWCQYFANGGQYYGFKDYEGRVRAVRRLLVIQ